MKIVYCLVFTILLLIGCDNTTGENPVIADEVSVDISPSYLNLNKKSDTILVRISPAEGWKLRGGCSIIDKDTIHANFEYGTENISIEEEWFSIKKNKQDSIMQVIVKENNSISKREVLLDLSYLGIFVFRYRIEQTP